MLYLCIPTRNEAPTVGLLLWRIRKIFQSYPREYEIIVFDDGSSDGTAEILASYRAVLPLTLLGSERHVGYARALESCFRTASERSRYPRRDAIVVMQADFTDAPEHLPELVRRFEGGADVVTADRMTVAEMPPAVKHLRRIGHWLIGRRARNLGTTDPLSGFRLYRLAVVRELLKRTADNRLLGTDGPPANVELLIAASTVARRLESVSVAPRYELRQRETRVRTSRQTIALMRLRRRLAVG